METQTKAIQASVKVQQAVHRPVQQPPEKSVDEFISLVKAGIESWSRAAEIARAEIDKDIGWPDKVCEKYPNFVSPAVINRFAGIGLKYIPQLALIESAGAKRLRKLPLALQQKYINEPLPVLIKGENGRGYEPLLLNFCDMTPDQAAQVIAHDRVRTDSEQRAWIEDRKKRKSDEELPQRNAGLPWRAVDDEIEVTVPTRFKTTDLLEMLRELENQR
jgi:hypothetical protein